MEEIKWLSTREMSQIDLSKPSLDRRYYGYVSPELATKWMASGTNKRMLSQTFISNYLLKSIEEGEWDGLVAHADFDEFGRMINGYHTCTAIVKSGKVLRMHIQTGLPSKYSRNIDCGNVRNLSSRFMFDEEARALFGEMLPWKIRKLTEALNFVSLLKTKCTGKITVATAIEHCRQNETLVGMVELFGVCDRVVGRPVFLVALSQMSERNSVMAFEFGMDFFNKRHPSQIQQAQFLRQWALMNAQGGSGQTFQINLYRKSVYCMKACLSGKVISRISNAEW